MFGLEKLVGRRQFAPCDHLAELRVSARWAVESERRRIMRFRIIDPMGTPVQRTPLRVPHSAQVATWTG